LPSLVETVELYYRAASVHHYYYDYYYYYNYCYYYLLNWPSFPDLGLLQIWTRILWYRLDVIPVVLAYVQNPNLFREKLVENMPKMGWIENILFSWK